MQYHNYAHKLHNIKSSLHHEDKYLRNYHLIYGQFYFTELKSEKVNK